MSVFAGFPITVNLAILSAAVGGGWLVWVRKSGRIGNLLDREHNSTQSWRDRLIPGTSFVLAVILLSVWIIGSGGREADIPNNPNALPPAAPDQQVPAGDCSEPVTEKLVQMSHHAFASAAFEDSGIDVKPGGYVQQRFIAATAQIASIAVINSRPGTEGPFDPQHIGQLRLSLYRADDQANNIQAIPLKALRSDAAPSADGIVVDAGPNHLQTVFQFCPVPLEPGERYAFRVTNETPGVILAFSLNTKANLRTSIDYVGEIHGEDRHRINYFQVAGYVCSLASC
jgi:hypothetical protein